MARPGRSAGARIAARLLILLLALALARPAGAEDLSIGVSWSNFQEERWKRDEAALREELSRLGARYLSADAQSSTEKQLADVESLIARGAQALVIAAHDPDAIGPALALARAEGIPVVGYDRLIESPGVFYVSFDNREVGRLQARELLKRTPRGRYVFIKGSAQDPNSDLVHAGQLDVLRPAIEAGEIEVVGDQYVDRWLPEVAQRTFEQVLTAAGNRVDAVVCSNDAMAGGVIAALRSEGMAGIPVSGQDGDHAALVRVAEGAQTVSVWKDSRALGGAAARVAVALARGTSPDSIEGRVSFGGGSRAAAVDAILLAPVPITRDNLGVVLDAGWIERAKLCRPGVPIRRPRAGRSRLREGRGRPFTAQGPSDESASRASLAGGSTSCSSRGLAGRRRSRGHWRRCGEVSPPHGIGKGPERGGGLPGPGRVRGVPGMVEKPPPVRLRSCKRIA